jgi:hypothetical protein
MDDVIAITSSQKITSSLVRHSSLVIRHFPIPHSHHAR